MQKPIALLLLCVATLTSYAQETKKVTKHYSNPWYKEEFFVLKAAPTTRQGAYARYEGRGDLTVKGYYSNGLKDSLWTEYHWGSTNIRNQGKYRNDQKVGVWEVYNFKGELTQQYDYTKRQLLFNKPAEAPEKITAKPLAPGITLDTKPVYIGGADAISQIIGRNTRYPTAALRSRVGGEVRVAFTVDANGTTSNHRVVKGIGAGCDEESLRVVRLLPDAWVPAQAGGQPVAAEVEIPVTYVVMR
jgi:TonB family protein